MGNTTYIAPAGEQTLMDTDLNTLGINYINVGVVIIDNTTNRYLYAEFEVYLPSVDLSAQVNPAIELYLIPSYDGTNYADTGTDGATTPVPPAQYLVAVMGVAVSNAAHRAVSPHILIDPIKYTPVVINKTGVALAGTLNTLKASYYTPTTA
jgi:hypothetical protein